MARVFRCLLCSYLAIQTIGASCACFAEKLTEEQQQRAAQLRAVLSTDAHRNRIQGRWTHINLDKVHEVTREGLWLERRKKGGIHSQGMWQVHDDGTYVVELDNKWRIRAWPAGHDKVVLVWFDPEGALDGDGAILSRE